MADLSPTTLFNELDGNAHFPNMSQVGYTNISFKVFKALPSTTSATTMTATSFCHLLSMMAPRPE